MACTSMDGYWEEWDWNWWESDNPEEEFDKGTYDVEDLISKVVYELEGKEIIIEKENPEWKSMWRTIFPEKLYGKCFTIVPPSNVDKVTFHSPIGDPMTGPMMPNLKVIFHTENKTMDQVAGLVFLS